MSKKKNGSIAVPFLVTIFVGLLIVGGAAFGIYKYFGLGNDEELKDPTPRQVATSTYEDNHTILMILDDPEIDCPATFVMMRSIPKEKKLLFVGIPTNTIALINDKQQSMNGAYTQGGPQAAVDFVQNIFGVTIDRYLKMNGAALIKICDILGGVTYPVKADIIGFKSDGTDQYLNSEQILKLMTYSLFDDGEIQRAYVASSIAADMVNQADGNRIADRFDDSFNTIANMSDTNITSVDYKNRKVAIKNMLSRGTKIASFLIMDGQKADGDFIPSSGFINNVVDQYFKDGEGK